MKTNRFTQLFTVAFTVAAFSSAGCARDDKVADTSVPPAKDTTTTTVTTNLPLPATTTTTETTTTPASSTTVQIAPTADADAATWGAIKDFSYDQRANFFTGFKALEARADAEVNELAAQRAAMTSTANTKDWDFAMKEMSDARAYLRDMGNELEKSSSDNWGQNKDRVGLAWVRNQNAYRNVKSSTTT